MLSMDVIVTEVTKENLEQLWPYVLKNVKNSSFIAMDAEMSGLGAKSDIMKSDVEQRYKGICLGAQTHSIISLGLACFESDSENPFLYHVSVYNFILLCADPFTIDPSAVSFLVNHGFNFNKQFSSGINYYRGNDKETANKFTMRKLFSEIIKLRKPLVLHNGLVDLVFLYQSFYADLPATLNSFMADLCEIFPNGIFDCKYIAEFCDRLNASYLLYVFKENQLKNEELTASGNPSLKVHFRMENEGAISIPLNIGGENGSKSIPEGEGVICEKYAAYGWCAKGIGCKKSHNIDAIVHIHRSKKDNKRKRKRKKSSSETTEAQMDTKQTNPAVNTENGTTLNQNHVNKTASHTQGHRSSLDSFMTGYVFATYITSRCTDLCSALNRQDQTSNEDEAAFKSEIPNLTEENRNLVLNKLFLSGKPIPLQVRKSQYSKTSKHHTEKLLKVYLS
uniref:C3H1-type domain-containing protein n=1 Tax=Ciona savignyi TaxID=51511 RepID=H2YQR8_CIOSA